MGLGKGLESLIGERRVDADLGVIRRLRDEQILMSHNGRTRGAEKAPLLRSHGIVTGQVDRHDTRIVTLIEGARPNNGAVWCGRGALEGIEAIHNLVWRGVGAQQRCGVAGLHPAHEVDGGINLGIRDHGGRERAQLARNGHVLIGEPCGDGRGTGLLPLEIASHHASIGVDANRRGIAAFVGEFVRAAVDAERSGRRELEVAGDR